LLWILRCWKKSFRFLNWPVKVNTLIFPNLDSANITYKLLKELNHVDSIGPIMLGMGKPVHIFQLGAVWKKWLIWLPLPLLMLKKSRRKKISTVLNKKHSYSIGCFYYKQSIFRQNTNQSNDSTFTRQVSRKKTNTCYYWLWRYRVSREHLLHTYSLLQMAIL
jgi:hypothetical protein